ncbi:MAG: hypothetical protein HHJ09_14005 [Glaciimonas sp.]|nr:hypothetical protein [Glaciimonas sp.]
MDHNIFFMLFNAIIATLVIVMFYPVFKAKHVQDLHEALKTRPVLAKTIARKNARSYLRSSIYFAISFVAYGVIAIGDEVEVDMDLATLSLLILFAITLARVWKLRKLLGSRASPVAMH